VASILFPPIRLPKGIPSIRIELIIILLAWMLLLLGHFAIRKPIKFHRNPVYKWFVLFGFAIFLSISYGAIVKGFPVIGRDFWEFPKLFGYFLIFALVANLDISPNEIRHYYKIALIIFLCSAFIGCTQYLNLGNINKIVSPYYAPTQIKGLLLQGRITGTTGNPNEFGAMMILASSLALSGILFFKKRLIRLFSVICFIIFSFTIVLTLSRSAAIAFIVSTFFIILVKYPLKINVKRNLWSFLIIILMVIIIYILIVKLAPENFLIRIGGLRNLVHIQGWQARTVKWEEAFALWKISPIFGLGPGKGIITMFVDNEWLLLLVRYGIFGITIFIAWIISFFFSLSKICYNSTISEVITLTVALQATLIAYAVFMIPAGIYHSLQLMSILLIFLGLAYSQIQAKRKS
jgi:O-antigen ligase